MIVSKVAVKFHEVKETILFMISGFSLLHVYMSVKLELIINYCLIITQEYIEYDWHIGYSDMRPNIITSRNSSDILMIYMYCTLYSCYETSESIRCSNVITL